MSGGDHHIRQQQLIIELPAVSTRQAAHWHDRLERLQQRVIAPELRRQFDRRAPPGVTVRLDRLCVEVSVNGPDGLDAEFADGFAAALARELAAATEPFAEQSAPPPSDFRAALLYFLTTGNLSWAYPTTPTFAAATREWLESAKRKDWMAIFELLARWPEHFLGRGAQVPGPFLSQAWRVLNTGLEDAAEATDPFTAPPADPAAWQARYRTATGGPSQAAPKPEADLSQPAAQSSAEPEGFHPENAGLVLLHPYLAYLLREVGALEEGDGPPDRPRAAALLHYLVTGRTDCREWELPLTKVLLGLSPADLLPCAATLSDSDLEAADDLLDGVIGHWSALGNTSREGLREGFLQRPGILTAVAGGWQLDVERRAHDVLLDRLPWGFHLIKTPWMAGRLSVNWS